MTVDRTTKVAWLFLGCLALFSVVNLLACPISWNRQPEILALACFGAIGAEACLLSIWCVLAPTSRVVRLVTGIEAALVLSCAWAVGYVVSQWKYEPWRWSSDLTTAFSWVPLLLFAAQSPAWAMKYWFQWRIAAQADKPQEYEKQSLGIRELMFGTGVIALCLALGRIGSNERDMADEGIVVLGVATATVLAFSTLTIIPATIATLKSNRLVTALPVILATNTATLAAWVVTISIIAQDWPPSSMLPEAVALVVSFTVCLTVPLLIARRLGYRLRWGRE